MQLHENAYIFFILWRLNADIFFIGYKSFLIATDLMTEAHVYVVINIDPVAEIDFTCFHRDSIVTNITNWSTFYALYSNLPLLISI